MVKSQREGGERREGKREDSGLHMRREKMVRGIRRLLYERRLLQTHEADRTCKELSRVGAVI